MRINKYIASRSQYSRRQADDIIKSGRVSINGSVLSDLSYRVSDGDNVFIDDKPLDQQSYDFVYYVLNKPRGYECSAHAEESVLDLVPSNPPVSYVGRLDKMSEGLLVLTNDGDLAYKMTHPKFFKEKEYEVTVDRNLREDQLKLLRSGMVIDGYRTQPCEVVRVSMRKFKIVLTEGRNRQIRKMCRKLTLRVHRLKRLRVGSLTLNTPLGDYTELNSAVFADFR